MRFVWDDSDDCIGFHKLHIEDDRGIKLPASGISFWDYTCEFQKNKASDRVERGVDYYWSWCHGWSHSEDYMSSENLTLQQAKRRAEIWLANMFIHSYETSLENVERLKPVKEWAEKEIGDEENGNDS